MAVKFYVRMKLREKSSIFFTYRCLSSKRPLVVTRQLALS